MNSRREYHYKNPTMAFHCPLCGTHRVVRYRPRLSVLNYIQVLFLSMAFIYFAYPMMGMRSTFIFFVIWFGFEATVRVLFKQELPCPHCGFDASWYKRDVKIARRKVEEFWAERANESKTEEELEESEALSHRVMDRFDSEELHP